MSSNNLFDSGLACLLALAHYHEVSIDEMKIRHQFGDSPFDSSKIVLAANSFGLSGRIIKQDAFRLEKSPLPAIALLKNGNFLIVAKYQNGKVLVQHPNENPIVISLDDLTAIWTESLIFLTSKVSYRSDTSKFDFTWFIPIIVKYRAIFTEVLIISLILQFIALVTPLFFQIIMDKVLVNNSLNTLNVMAIAFFIATMFEAILNGIRSWVFSHTSSKIDVELGARLFKHLLELPIAYFHSRRVGDSVARVRELENIRSFLASNAITVVLDILFSVLFICVMFWYSVPLTIVVLCSIPVYVIISLIFTPILRKRLDDKFVKGAENQAFLVESINGIDTLKSLAVEPRWNNNWDKQLADYVGASQAVSNISIFSSNAVSLTSKLVTVIIMWLGATLVIDNKLTVGQLIAFNMFASHVSGPILRLAQLWNEFQQVGISMERLGDILNSRTEISGHKTRLPRLLGKVELDQVWFRYRPDAADIIRNISLSVSPGEVIGIVGRSGSGKSTLTKLIQRLYVPDRGRVLVDGYDISIIDTSSLRQQIGVVLQENILFNRSVKDNIAISNPTSSLESIISAAKLAGAHEFICELPEAYDTIIGEHGTGLSGGQRQRIAIARTLIGNPRILIFDEATSALDYESEAIIQANMQNICKNRTVFIIAHRLSAVKHADRILVIDRGQIVESGTHQDLVAMPNGLYAHLNSIQKG